MLNQLEISGLAIIESLIIEFAPGFNVITGETGAGKSILIKALNLVLGGKTPPDIVRSGHESASVVAQFTLPVAHKVTSCLEKFGIPLETCNDANQTIIVRRSINSKGKSSAWINDIPVTSTTLRTFGSSLVDVFAQHENHKLLDGPGHLAVLDQFLDDRNIAFAVEKSAEEVFSKLDVIKKLTSSFAEKQRDADYLMYRCSELRKFGPSTEDYESVRGICDGAKNVTAILSSLKKAESIMMETFAGVPLERVFRDVSRSLEQAAEKSDLLTPLSDLALEVVDKVLDLKSEISAQLRSLDINEEDLDNAQARLAGYQALYRKFSVLDIESLMTMWQRMEAATQFVACAADTLEVEIADLVRLLTKYEELSPLLSKARCRAAKLATKIVVKELGELAMKGARFEVDLSPLVKSSNNELDLSSFGGDLAYRWQKEIMPRLNCVSANGCERAQFMLSANPGEPPLPLHKVASGGEVSRIMLALKKALSTDADTCVLVFDEIDTGISGRVAGIVGKKLAQLARGFQVVCISHLPQVAVYADAHFRVVKVDCNARTESSIHRLSSNESQLEIARLLSGDEVTESSMTHAGTLIKKAREEIGLSVLIG